MLALLEAGHCVDVYKARTYCLLVYNRANWSTSFTDLQVPLIVLLAEVLTAILPPLNYTIPNAIA